MVSFSKLVLGALALVASAVAQTANTYPVNVQVPVTDVDTFTVSFDLLANNAIPNAARELCFQKQKEFGLATQDDLARCVASVEQHITSVLLANKIVERTSPPKNVVLTIPFEGAGSYEISFDPSRTTPVQTAEYLCVEKQTELGITTQAQLDSCIAGVTEFIGRSQTQQTAMKAAPVTAERKPDVRKITIPVADVGDIPLTLDINAVTANQAAEYVCREHANRLGLSTMDDLNKCIPPFSEYIQNQFQTTSRPPISMSMSVNNGVEFQFSFDPTTPINTVANDLCLAKASDFGIQTQQQLVDNCIPPVAAYIRSNLSRQ